MNKKLLSITLAAAMTLSMGTMAFADEAEASYENCTLTFDWWGGDTRHQATQDAIAAFEEKYPGIEVQANYGAWDGWESAEALKFNSQKTADVTQINASWINAYDANGETFLDLNTVADTLDFSQWDEDILKMCEDPVGGLASVPVSLTGRVLYFDKTSFDEVGVEIPKTIQDLLDCGDAFGAYDDGYYPLVLGAYDRALFMTQYLSAKYSKPVYENGELMFTEEELQEGVEFIQSLVDHHVIPALDVLDGDGASSTDQNPKWTNGQYAGIYEWDSSFAKYAGALAEGREFVVGDELEEMKAGTFYKVTLSFAISAQSEHPHEAALLINYLLNDPEGIKIMAAERGIPASAIAYETLSEAGLFDEATMEAHTKIFDVATYFLDTSFFDDATLKDVAEGAFQDAFSGIDYGDYEISEAVEILFEALTAVTE